MTTHDPQVSFDNERLILVDANDNVVGYDTKDRAHDGNGTLHRAFSVFLFDAQGRVLIQQRSADKRLWPLFWSNSCCSHPREGEVTEVAAARRIREELAVSSALTHLYAFQYQARFGAQGSENELCHVFVGRVSSEVTVNRREVAAHKWLAPGELTKAMAATPEQFTPWFKMEWERIVREHWQVIATLA